MKIGIKSRNLDPNDENSVNHEIMLQMDGRTAPNRIKSWMVHMKSIQIKINDPQGFHE